MAQRATAVPSRTAGEAGPRRKRPRRCPHCRTAV